MKNGRNFSTDENTERPVRHHLCAPLNAWIILVTILLTPLLLHSQPAFDHSAFDALLRVAVVDGVVEYSVFRTSPRFAQYLKRLERAPVAEMSLRERLAFWINAYNALAIRQVLNYPAARKPTDIPEFFTDARFIVAGSRYSLNDIEHKVIRPAFRERLIHFGLVCAARSCPPLLSSAYTARNVIPHLESNARSFLSSGQNGISRDGTALELSKIFEWYETDFGGASGIRAFVRRYGPPRMRELAGDPKIRLTFREYDWSLNGTR